MKRTLMQLKSFKQDNTSIRQLILEYKSLYGEDMPEYSSVFRSLEETSER